MRSWASVEIRARDADESYGERRMREGGESSISRSPRPGFETFHMARQRSQMRELMFLLQVVTEIGREDGAGRRVAALAASSANSLPMTAEVQLVMEIRKRLL
jgi:hypothetical protein